MTTVLFILAATLPRSSRGGLAAAFNLSYNSQNWRVGSTTEEEMGVDAGYGGPSVASLY